MVHPPIHQQKRVNGFALNSRSKDLISINGGGGPAGSPIPPVATPLYRDKNWKADSMKLSVSRYSAYSDLFNFILELWRRMVLTNGRPMMGKHFHQNFNVL